MIRLTLISTILFCFLLNGFCQHEGKISFYFNKGEFKLNQIQEQQFDKSIDSMHIPLTSKFIIKGYADNEGGKNKNKRISLKRALFIADYLIHKGFDSSQILATGLGQIGDSNIIQTEYEKSKNRKVSIYIISKYNEEKEKELKISNPIKFESDTIIYGKYGTQLRIKGEAFYPKKIKDVKIIINEIFSLCDSIPDDVETVTESGICLASGGMAFIEALYKKKSIKPNRNAMFEVRIPVINNDTNLKFYIAVRQSNGSIRWRERKGNVLFENGKYYFVFETNILGGFNCDVPIKGCDMNSNNNYILKTWTRTSSVKIFINNQFSFYAARKIKGKKYAIPSNINPENIYVAAEGYESNDFCNLVLTLPRQIWDLLSNTMHLYQSKKVYKMSELKYKKRRKIFKLRRKNFEEVGSTMNTKTRELFKCK